MIHDKRRFNITDVETPEELAEKLTNHSWTLCTGFRHDGRLYLNDAFSEDGAQEYAVVKDGRQIESITFGWCTYEKAFELIREIDAGKYDHEDYSRVEVREHGKGSCQLCA